MKKRALAIALSLALLLSVFVPGTLATSSTETETDTTTVVSQSDTEVLAEDGEGTLSGDGQSVVTDGDTVTGDGQTTGEGTVTGDGQTADEGTVTGDGQTTGEGTVTGDGQTTDQGAVTGDGQTTDQGTVTGDGQTTEEGTVTGDGQTAGEGTVTDDGQTVDEGNVTGDGQTADPTEATAATEPTVAADPTETTAATEPTDPVCTCPGTEEEKAAEGFVHQEGCPYYVETAPAMPQLMLMIAADIRAGGSETIGPGWFRFTNVQTPDGFVGVEEGEITAGKVPDIKGYTFVGAYVEDIPVDRIGQIVFEGKTYVYYTTEGSSDVAAMVLGDEDTIELRYSLDAVQITYSVTVDGKTVDGNTVEGVPYGGNTSQQIQVIPSTNPTEVFPGNLYSFTVEIPRGYQATVYVNSEKQDPELGRFPEYKNDGTTDDAITSIGPETVYWANYSVENAEGPQSVRVDLKEIEPKFSAELITDTKYFKDGDIPRASYQVNDANGTTGEIINGSVTWKVTTNRNNWVMNKLEINETKIEVPFSNNSPIVTTLPSGTVVTVSRVERGNNYVYSIACTNCYEDLVVTAGNLNGVNHQEYMPWEYVGVAQAQYFHGGDWHDLTIGVPVKRSDLETSTSRTDSGWTSTTTTTTYTAQFRFKPLPGYGNPNLTINDKTIKATLGTDGWFTTAETEVYTTTTTQGWGGPSTTTDDKEFGGYTRYIDIIAQPIDVPVDYQSGTVSGATNIPQDSGTYNLTNNPQVRIPTTIPMDPRKEMVFQGWQNGAEIYLPNAVIDLEDLAIENGKVTFTAQWISVENATQIQFTIQIVEDSASGEVLKEITSNAPKGVPIILDVNSDTIQTWRDEHPEYEISDDNTLYHDSISQGDVVKLIVKERTATITYTVIGPEGAGTVTPPFESVKVKSGEASGSTPTAKTGYRFVGWYEDQDCTKKVDASWVDADGKLTPKKSGELWEDAVYYAKFEPAVASLTITASGIEGTYDAQGTIYQVEVDAADGESDKTFYVSINGESSVTIENLPYGEYTVTPMNDWSWRYDNPTSQTVTPKVQGDGTTMAASVTFDYGIQNYKWLSGNDYFACN